MCTLVLPRHMYGPLLISFLVSSVSHWPCGRTSSVPSARHHYLYKTPFFPTAPVSLTEYLYKIRTLYTHTCTFAVNDVVAKFVMQSTAGRAAAKASDWY